MIITSNQLRECYDRDNRLKAILREGEQRYGGDFILSVENPSPSGEILFKFSRTLKGLTESEFESSSKTIDNIQKDLLDIANDSILMEPIYMDEDNCWGCNCGNYPHNYGFYPCNDYGIEIEPIKGLWDSRYVCMKCYKTCSVDEKGDLIKS